ncbi:TonB-dependent hemoglobin/transferrin/lactoferrin family receptor [Aliirhizobium smilacinae]|uniref:TonB-dependent hemoglobin/transferrin/lactoferrin family receptor n=1 Tax=Aliirhizobium smilacinae TaxID=1395944 RepID=A0A5C4XHQ5_9HYPH|nr:TonB-dependent hemoglobin/transferrin/lactoferrin family receptor [Rhizobium smilacinae]TNM62947.1 TonB-dependent hemoglobin/transferrin/lactoferrin family receptor [Rhizobium smilacinae]
MGSIISRQSYLFAGSALFMVFSATGSAQAQNATTPATPAQQAQTQNGTTTELAPIELRAGRTSQVPAASPLTQTTERQVIQQRMVTDFKDFARRVDAGVNFNSANQSINIRGLQDDRILTTIDGIRQPWLVDPRGVQGGITAFDFDSLSSVDITKGADSSRFGSGALGGTVELKTLNPEDIIDSGKNFGALTKSTYDSTDDSFGNNAAIAGRSGDTWLLVQGSFKKGHETKTNGDVGGYNTTRGDADPADFWQRNLLVKFHQYLEGGHRFGLAGEVFDRNKDIDSKRGTTLTNYEQGSLRSGEDVNRKRLSGSYDFISPGNEDIVDQANVTVYWQKEQLRNTTDGFRLRDGRADIPSIGGAPSGEDLLYGFPTGIYTRDNKLQQTSYGINGSASKEATLGGFDHNFRFGGDLYWTKTHQYSAGEDNCPDVDWSTIPQLTIFGTSLGPQTCRMLHSNSSDMADVNGVTFGAFVEDDIKFFDDRLTLTPGVRMDWYSYDPKDTPEYQASPNYDPAYLQKSDDFGISPKLRAAWKATQELELFAQYTRGFRAPNVLELYQNYGAPGSYARIGNPELETETSNGFEIGAKYQATDYALQATVFNNYYRNFIDTVELAAPGGEYPVGGVTGYENRNKVHIYGVELGGQWQFQENWRTWGSFAWTYGKDTETGDYLNSVAPRRAILGVGYSTETWGSDLSLTLASAHSKVADDDNDFKAPGYGLVDATVWWTPEKVGEFDLTGLKVQAGVFNVFDKKYWDAVSTPDTVSGNADYYTEPGRTFKVSISKKF